MIATRFQSGSFFRVESFKFRARSRRYLIFKRTLFLLYTDRSCTERERGRKGARVMGFLAMNRSSAFSTGARFNPTSPGNLMRRTGWKEWGKGLHEPEIGCRRIRQAVHQSISPAWRVAIEQPSRAGIPHGVVAFDLEEGENSLFLPSLDLQSLRVAFSSGTPRVPRRNRLGYQSYGSTKFCHESFRSSRVSPLPLAVQQVGRSLTFVRREKRRCCRGLNPRLFLDFFFFFFFFLT